MKSLVGGGAGCSTNGAAAAVAPSYLSKEQQWVCRWDGKTLIISKQATVDGKTKEISVSGRDIGKLRHYVVENIRFITDSMEDESQTIALFEYIHIDVTNIFFNTNGELKTSLLSYLFYKYLHPQLGIQPVCEDIPYKLIWWLIEHGADVNHRNSLPRGGEGVNVFTILGDVIQLLTNFNFSTTPIMKSDETWNLINLTDFYNIVYTLVLLLSRGANMQMNIVNWDSKQYTITTTALEMLKTKDDAWMTQMKELSRNLNSMSERSTFDRESQDAIGSDTALKAKTDIMIQKFKILTDPFNSVLDLIKAPPQEDKRLLQDVKTLCINAMGEVDRLQPHVKVVWMIESVPGNNMFIDLDEKSSNVFEGSFKVGDEEVVSGTLEKPDSKTDFRTMKFTKYEYVTVGESGKPLPLPSPSGSKESAPDSGIVERKEIVKRIWRDIRVSIDPSKLSDLQWEGTLTQRDPDVTWFYVSDDGTKVKSYSLKIAEVIENALMNGLQSVEYNSPILGVNWVFDLKNMRQTNTKSMSTRSIKRGKVKWVWESDDGKTFNQFQPDDARLLEEKFNNDSTNFNHHSKPWNFDLANIANMIQTNTSTGSKRSIRRIFV
jgi:hypothetical protein